MQPKVRILIVAAAALALVVLAVALWPTDADTDASAPTTGAASRAATAPAGRDLTLPGTWVDVAATPPSNGSVPLIIALHGRGDSAEHFSAIAARLAPGFDWRFLDAPLPFTEGHQWFRADQPDGGRADLEASLRLLDAHVQAAGRTVALVGFSQGCSVAAHYAIEHATAIRAVLCIGGALVYAHEAPREGRAPEMLFVHGTDDPIVPIDAARRTVQLLRSRGYRAAIVEHNEGHAIPETQIARLGRWLERKASADLLRRPRLPRPAGSLPTR